MAQLESPSDPLMLLIQRISDTQTQQGVLQAKHTEDQHAIRLTLARLEARLEPLSSLIPDLTALRLASQHHSLVQEQHNTQIGALQQEVHILNQTSAARGGWEGLGGKVLYLVGGGVVSTILLAITYFLGNKP